MLRFPVDNPSTTSKYGWRTLNGKQDFHPGWDFVSNQSPKVFAIADGIVTYDMDNYEEAKRWTDPKSSAGNYLIIQHTISGVKYYVRYFHLGFNTKKVGDIVVIGDHLGDYGDYGYSFGPHLHIDFWNMQWAKNIQGTTIIDPSTIFNGVIS